MSIIRMIRTIRYLKPGQIAGQIRHRLCPFLERPNSFFQIAAPGFDGCQWGANASFLAPGAQINTVDKIRSGRLAFLNQEETIGWPPADWDVPELPKLWQYNLHYFEWLWALDYESVRKAILDWNARHPLAKGRIGWEPYPTSLRLMNWCAVCFGKFRKQTEEDKEFVSQLWRSIFIQAQWLTRHLETHLLGNHFFENGAALAFVGSCFLGATADKWIQTGINILCKEIPEQILNDSMHFELSPMYHCRIIYLLAMLLNTDRAQLVNLVKQPLGKMVYALGHLVHPDGQIALLNDSAFGIYNAPAQLISYVRNFFEIDKAGLGNFALAEAGYYGFRDNKGTYLICDAAQIGPDYIPGHTHADMFSFELSLKGHRVIVDSGVYDYEVSPTRQYCRSTKAHNTLEINGQDQCEMWAAFRVARMGRLHNIEWMPGKDGFQLSGWHDGYKRLTGSPVHYRKFNWNNSEKLTVKDITNASKPQNIISRLHLHPNCKIDQLKGSTVWATYPEGGFKVIFFGNGKLSLEDSYYCPEFSVKIANKALAFSFSGRKTETGFQIEVL